MLPLKPAHQKHRNSVHQLYLDDAFLLLRDADGEDAVLGQGGVDVLLLAVLRDAEVAVEGAHRRVAPAGPHLPHAALDGELLVVLQHLYLAPHELQHVQHHPVRVLLLDEAEGLAVRPQRGVPEALVQALVDRRGALRVCGRLAGGAAGGGPGGGGGGCGRSPAQPAGGSGRGGDRRSSSVRRSGFRAPGVRDRWSLFSFGVPGADEVFVEAVGGGVPALLSGGRAGGDVVALLVGGGVSVERSPGPWSGRRSVCCSRESRIVLY